jgi:hypothetical protein
MVSVSFATTSVYMMMWTEPVFVALTLVTLLTLARAIRRGDLLWWEILVIAVSVSVATSFRFIGVTLLPVVAFGTLITYHNNGLIRSVRMSALVTGLSTLGLIAIGLRNMFLGVSPFGERAPSDLFFLQVAKDTVMSLGLYVYPTTSPTPWIAALIGIPIAFLLAYGVFITLANRAKVASPLVLFLIIYWAALWYSQFATTIDKIGPRLTAPIFTPMLIVLIYAVRDISFKITTRTEYPSSRQNTVLTSTFMTFLIVGLGCTLLANSGRSLIYVRDAASLGVGYNSKQSLASPLAVSLKNMEGFGIAATDPALAYWTSGHSPILAIPRRDHYWSDAKTAKGVEVLNARVANRDVSYLAFFNSSTTALDPSELRKAGMKLRLVKSYSDGDLYTALP